MASKVFLSHSSAQKKLVEEVAKELGIQNIHFDEWTFESGNKTWDEILAALDNSGLFVLLASRKALESKWVKDEIDKAKELLDTGKLKGFFAINIDDGLEITSRTKNKYPNFPQWVVDEYNMRRETSPKVIASKIKNKFNSILYELDSDYRQYRDIYFGRDEEKAIAKRRIADRMQAPLSCFVVSGFDSIGRKKFLKKVLEESSVIRAHQEPIVIMMGENESVENFILKLYASQFTDLKESEILDLGKKDLESKFKLAVKGLLQIGERVRLLIIEDPNAIVDFDGVLADWFDKIICALNKERDNKLLIGLVTRTRINARFLAARPDLFQSPIKPLPKKDCVAIFNTLCEIENIVIDNPKHIELIADTFNGSPDQIFYAVKYILGDSLAGLLQNIDVLRNFNFKRAARILEQFKGDKVRQSRGLLKTLSLLNIFSLDLIDKVVVPIYGSDATYKIISSFSNNHIIDLLKYDSFVYQVNRSIRIYVSTNKDWKEDTKISSSLSRYLQSSADELISFLENDFSLYELLIREGLLNNWEIDPRLVLPSYQLNLMIQKYREGRYEDVFQISDELLDNSKNLDQTFMNRVLQWYCKALIKDGQDTQFKSKVELITDKIMRLILLGFFHRRHQRYATAIEFLKKAEGMKAGGGTMLPRELALCYSDTDDPLNAYKYARKFYEQSPPNPFSANLYFRSLVRHTDLDVDYKSSLQKLLVELKQLEGEDGDDYLIAQSQYLAFIDSNQKEAYETIDRAIHLHTVRFNHGKLNGYPYLEKMSYCALFSDAVELGRTISEFEDKFQSEPSWFSKPQYLKYKMRYFELKGDRLNADKYRSIYLEKSRGK